MASLQPQLFKELQGYSSHLLALSPMASVMDSICSVSKTFVQAISAFNIFSITVSLGNISCSIIGVTAELKTSAHDLLKDAD